MYTEKCYIVTPFTNNASGWILISWLGLFFIFNVFAIYGELKTERNSVKVSNGENSARRQLPCMQHSAHLFKILMFQLVKKMQYMYKDDTYAFSFLFDGLTKILQLFSKPRSI